MLVFFRPALGLIVALALSVPFTAQSAEPLDWRPWNEWDNATKSFVPIDGSTERREDVHIAKAQLNPDLKEFLFIYRQSLGWCGSRGCSLEVLAPTALDGGYSPVGRGGYRYAHFGAWTVPEVAIDTSKRVNGWYGLVLSGNTWVFNGSEYVLP